jgi:hypothetical protein
MHLLYEPHCRLHGDPKGRVHLSDFSRCQAEARATALLAIPGRHCSATSTPAPPAPASHDLGALSQHFLIYTDAAKNGAKTTCLGGLRHGFFFSVHISHRLRASPIQQLEFDISVPADFASRDRPAGLYDLSALLGITPARLEVP